jgi:hypothetical protein
LNLRALIGRPKTLSGPRRADRLLCTAALAVFFLPFAGARTTQAGELDGFDGRLESNNTDAKTYSWGLEYREPLSDHFSASFLWLNEGHLPNNHRDGQALQLWWRNRKDPLGLVFEVGAGPYRYYDTHALEPDPDFHDAHGWGAVASAAADWYFANHWFTYLRVNEVSASDKYSSTALVLGAGYRFSSRFDLARSGSDAAADAAQPPALPWEIDVLVGERIGNTTHSETGLSEEISARRNLSEHIAVSVSYIAGQGTLLNWRDGFAAQFWLEQQLTSHLSVAAGAGGFIVSKDDSLTDASSPDNLAVIVSVSVAYSLTPRWVTRVVWDRIGTGDDHDADILQFGVGYRF